MLLYVFGMISLSYTITSLTPIVTGDNECRNTELLATGILGSLRYQYWLLKAMQAWQADPENPIYPHFEDDHLPARKGPNDTTFRNALAAAGPVVQLFGATNWKKMFRLEIAEAPKKKEQERGQPCSARSNNHIAPYHWKNFKLIFRQDRPSPIFDELAEKKGTSLEGEIQNLMAFVHQYGWLGAAPQNGLGWVSVQGQEIERISQPEKNPVFAAKDIQLSKQDTELLRAELIRYYEGKGTTYDPSWKLNRYAASVRHLKKKPYPAGYEIRRWLREQMFPAADYRNEQEKYFGNKDHAGFVHISHPDVQPDSSWRIRMRFTARPDRDKNGAITRLNPNHLDLAPQLWLDYCEKLLKQEKLS